jgi:3-phosphoglycerate kinase
MLVKNMLNFADEIVLGGGMKNPFLTHVFKREMGSSINIMPENPN